MNSWWLRQLCHEKKLCSGLRPHTGSLRCCSPVSLPHTCNHTCPMFRLSPQIVRSTSGNGKQTCNEVCSHLATQGVYGGLLAGQPNCLQPQFSESSLNPNQVDWLLSQPDLFGDLSPSGPAWVLWEGAKSSSSSQEQQQQQQQPSIAEDTTGAMKTRLPGCSTKKAKGKEKLSRACRQLLSGVVSGIGKMSRRVVKTAVKGISTTKQSGYSVGHVACCFMFCAIQQATQRRFRHPGIALSLGLYGFTLLLATIGQGTVNDAVQLGR